MIDDSALAAGGSAGQDIVHVRMQPWKGRKSITTIEGLNPRIDFELLLRAFRKLFHCSGTLISDSELGKVIQLQGDHRTAVAQFLVQEQIVTRDKIRIHGA